MTKTKSLNELLGKEETPIKEVPSLQGFQTPVVDLKQLIQLKAFESIFADLQHRYGASTMLGKRMKDFEVIIQDAVLAAIKVGEIYDKVIQEESVETDE